MTETEQFNFVTAVASYFGVPFTDFSKAMGVPHGTVSKWKTNARLPRWQPAQIMLAAKSLPKQDRREIQDLLDWGIS